MREDVSLLLGNKVNYTKLHDKDILVREKRSNNRIQYDIQEGSLPFVGVDVWNCYEVSFLTKKGMPVTAVAKITYWCDNPFIVESKSLKLYLNSFNMLRIGDTEEEAIRLVRSMIQEDLEELLEACVSVHFFFGGKPQPVFQKFVNIRTLVDISDMSFEDYNENPSLLRIKAIGNFEESVSTDLLRSNCKITNQADWGTLFLYYKSDKKLDLLSLCKYVVSFRGENHFHEEVVEMIYKRLWSILTPCELMVSAIYTRRGGIDICPMRASSEELFEQNLTSYNTLCDKLLRQ